jgi:DNA-binding LytR/AlgR family response regulator
MSNPILSAETTTSRLALTCVAVDDEPLALEVLADYCAQVPFVRLVATFTDGLAALAYVQAHPVDLLLLDVQMARLTGVALARMLAGGSGTKRPCVVFTTAHPHYAVESYELNATDYLLKPIAFERFLQAVHKVYQQVYPPAPEGMPAPGREGSVAAGDDAMFVRHEHRLQRVAFADILYVEGMKDYLYIHTPTGRILTLQSLRRVEEVLPPSRFVRIHKSFVVAINRIEHVERGKVQVAGRLLPIGETFRDGFMEVLRAHNAL